MGDLNSERKEISGLVTNEEEGIEEIGIMARLEIVLETKIQISSIVKKLNKDDHKSRKRALPVQILTKKEPKIAQISQIHQISMSKPL